MNMGVLTIIRKSQIAKLTTKMFDGVCKDFAEENTQITRPFPVIDMNVKKM